MEESVLRGNSAILKCHISTFVTEYVSVSSWIVSEGDTKELEINADDSNDLGADLFLEKALNPVPSIQSPYILFRKHRLVHFV